VNGHRQLHICFVGPRGFEPRTCGLRVWCKRPGQSAARPLYLRVCVSVIPIVSHRFPLLHGDETEMPCLWTLSFP
jgi:hypothetical protein